MAKPDYLTLIRHGQSQGNVNKRIYETIPDYAVQLTDEGINQVKQAAKELDAIFENLGPVAYYSSAYWRTRQTYMVLRQTIPQWKYYEDVRLREQEWTTSFGIINPDYEQEREAYGHMYYRYAGAESNADVYDRMSDFMNTLYRDFEKPDFPRAAIIVSHGMTMRVFLMRFFHMTVEEFELLANPKNAEVILLKLQPDGHYKLVTEPRKYESREHSFQFDWNDPRFM